MEPKQVIAPLQYWLLARGRCVGCGRLLAGESKKKKDGVVMITCTCQRIFVYEPQKSSYRRALFQEV